MILKKLCGINLRFYFCCSGYVDTELTRGEHLQDFRAQWIRDIPMKRLADVAELTGAVVYLASPLASYTTGLDFIIDGGATLW